MPLETVTTKSHFFVQNCEKLADLTFLRLHFLQQNQIHFTPTFIYLFIYLFID